MTMREQIREFILTELVTGGEGVDLPDSARLIDEGIIDSFGIMNLLGFIEENFSIEIMPEELMPENFASIATISDFLMQKGSAQPGR
jgi:acyl carrier protein